MNAKFFSFFSLDDFTETLLYWEKFLTVVYTMEHFVVLREADTTRFM
jgi:hypothetical protein